MGISKFGSENSGASLACKLSHYVYGVVDVKENILYPISAKSEAGKAGLAEKSL